MNWHRLSRRAWRPWLAWADQAADVSGDPGPVEVRQVSSRRDLNQFIRLPWRIYPDDPHWVPPLLVAEKEFLDASKHPFHLHAEVTQFLALRGGRPVGRILVSDDPHYNQQHEANQGCFGMFECLDDRPAAHALLQAAADWLRARGRTGLMGPIDYSTNYPCGLLIDGFDTPPRIMMNHDRPYYAGLLESWGLVKAKDLFSWWFTDPHDMVAKWRRRAERLAERSKIRVRPFRRDNFEADVERCRTVYNAAGKENWGFVKLSDAEFRYLAKQLAALAIPDLVLLAEVDGEPVGFSITLPDLNEAIHPLNGRLTTLGIPIGLARLLYRKRHVKTARMVVLDVVENYRRRGISELLILRTLDYGKNTIGYTGAELSWTLEDNYVINRMVEAVGAKRYKTYRIYEKQLNEPG